MKKIKSTLGLMLIICMVLSLFPCGITIMATNESEALDKVRPITEDRDTWSGEKDKFTAFTANYIESNNGWQTGTITYNNLYLTELTGSTFSMANYSSGTGQIMRTYFFYQDAKNYYGVSFKRGSNISATVELITSSTETGEVIQDTLDLISDAGKNTITITVNCDNLGNISVKVGSSQNFYVINPENDELILLSNVPSDSTLATLIYHCPSPLQGGKIGLSVIQTCGQFGRPTISGRGYDPAPPVTPPQVPQPVTLPYEAVMVTRLPVGTPSEPHWKGDGFRIDNSGWGQYSAIGTAGKLVGGLYCFRDVLDYSWEQISFWDSSTLYFYFMYQDEDNYYAVESTSSGSELFKIVNGVKTTLGTSYVSLKNVQVAIRIQRNANGKITVFRCERDNSNNATHQLFDVTDTSLTYGYIGIGYAGGDAGSSKYFAAPRARGYISANPEVITVPSAERINTVIGTETANPTDSAKARYLGRSFDFDSGGEILAAASFPMAGVEFYVTNATDVYIRLKNLAGSGSRLGIYIDDSLEYTRLSTSNFGTEGYLKAASFAEEGNHKIKIIKISGWGDTFGISEIAAVGTQPVISSTIPKSRRIEIIGDSITVGGGQYDPGSLNAAFGGDSGMSYGARTAAYFGADLNISAVGGGSPIKALADGTNTYMYYNNAVNRDHFPAPQGELNPRGWRDSSYPWNFTKFRPDIIVVNLGANAGDSDKPYVKQDFIDFHDYIREKYNDTEAKAIPILFVPGTIDAFAHNAWVSMVAAMEDLGGKDGNVYYAQIGSGMVTGTSYHPDFVSHIYMSEKLNEQITEIMGWESAGGENGFEFVRRQRNNNHILGSFEISNYDGNYESAVVVGGIYTKKNKLAAFGRTNIRFKRDVPLSAFGDITINLPLGLDLDEDDYEIKFLFWNTFELMEPVLPNVILSR